MRASIAAFFSRHLEEDTDWDDVYADARATFQPEPDPDPRDIPVDWLPPSPMRDLLTDSKFDGYLQAAARADAARTAYMRARVRAGYWGPSQALEDSKRALHRALDDAGRAWDDYQDALLYYVAASEPGTAVLATVKVAGVHLPLTAHPLDASGPAAPSPDAAGPEAPAVAHGAQWDELAAEIARRDNETGDPP
jgi:hypothetical protein